MIEWALLGAAALGAGGYALRVVQRGRVHRRWAKILDDVAHDLGARASAGSRFDSPQLRTEIDGTTVTIVVNGIDRGVRDRRGVATATLPDIANTVRFYFGWDVAKIPVAVEHVAEVPYPPIQRVDGDVKIRADDAAMATRFMREAILDLIDVRGAASAHALEVIAKGGYLELVVHGVTEQPAVLTRAARACARLATIVDTISRGTTLPAPEPEAPTLDDDATCALCDATRAEDEAWVVCAGCEAPYHAACFAQATACVRCGDTKSREAR
ncbi:MAG: hypothetical protein RMA76_33295 [Deltaproteobacteria bacterium]|jgi:hypothetical protein